MFSVRRGLKGDQFVEVRVVVPKQLSPRQKELLLEFQSEEKKKKKEASG